MVNMVRDLLLKLFASRYRVRALAALLGVGTLGVTTRGAAQSYEREASLACVRIVSLAPSLTEALFALGLGRQVVGVTRYDTYPPEVASLPRLGGFLDPAIESIIALQPTLVVGLSDSSDLVELLTRFRIDYRSFSHDRIAGLHASLESLGKLCGVAPAATKLVRDLKESEKGIAARVSDRRKPRVLVAVGRGESDGRADGVYVSGVDGFYADVVRIAGGEAAFVEKTAPLTSVSIEGLLAINPEVIVEISNRRLEDAQLDRVFRSWVSLQHLAARRGHSIRVCSIDGEEAVIPGPRYIELTNRFQEALFGGGRCRALTER